jgi:protein-S-isoprenylcysteine O-methyltransferase Ste14
MTPKAAVGVWFAGLVVWYIIRYPFERKAKRGRVSVSLFDRRDSISLAFAWLCLLVIPALYALTGFPTLLDRPMVRLLPWLGLASDCAALWLFYRSHADLGRNWSVSLQIREQHSLVKTGVYRLIRHPMYASFFLLGVAQMLLLPNWFVDAAGLTGAGVLFAARVDREEALMISRFADDYRSYMASTKRVIPWIV